MKKLCCHCSIEKDIDCFSKNKNMKDGYRNQCKECDNEYKLKNKEKLKQKSKEYTLKNKDKIKEKYENNKDVILEKNKEYYKNNKTERQKKQKEYYKNNKDGFIKRNKEKMLKMSDEEKQSFYKTKYDKYKENIEYKEKKKKYYIDNAKRLSIYRKEYYIKNQEILKNKSRLYKKQNKEKLSIWCKKYKDKNPHIFIWRRIVHRVLEQFEKKKEYKTIDILGYSAHDLKLHLENLFTDSMNWNNYGEWHVDHTKPISSFDKETDVSIVNALSNLKPMWATTREINGVVYEGNLNKSKFF